MDAFGNQIEGAKLPKFQFTIWFHVEDTNLIHQLIHFQPEIGMADSTTSGRVAPVDEI